MQMGEEKRFLVFFGGTSSLSVGTSQGWRKAVSASSALGLPPTCTPFPSEGRVSQVGALEVSHSVPTQTPSYLVQRSVCLSSAARSFYIPLPPPPS